MCVGGGLWRVRLWSRAHARVCVCVNEEEEWSTNYNEVQNQEKFGKTKFFPEKKRFQKEQDG